MIKISAMAIYDGPLDEVYIPIILPTEVGDEPWANYRMLASDLQGEQGEPGGEGSALTFENGLTKTLYDVVKLGGPLTEDTEIDVSGHSLSVTGLTEAVTSHVLYIDNTTGEITKGEITEGETVTADNGLTKTLYNVIELGGTPLYKHTNIDGASAFKLNLTNLRFQEDLGTGIASANDLTLGLDGNSFTITGATQINAITTTNWQAGSVVRLIFTSTPTVKHNTAGGGGTATILLSGAVDFVAVANDVLTLVYDGTNWHETSRKLSSTAVGFTRFGVSGEDATQAQTRAFAMGSNTFTITQNQTSSSSNFTIANTNTGTAFGATNNGGNSTAVFQNSGNGHVIFATATSGTALRAQTTSGTQAAFFQTNPSSTNTTVTVVTMQRLTSGTAANNIAGAQLMDLEAADGNVYQASKLVWKWTDATAATRTSSLIIQGTSNAIIADVVTVHGAGDIEVLTVGKGIIIPSPDGTRYRLTPANGGGSSVWTAV